MATKKEDKEEDINIEIKEDWPDLAKLLGDDLNRRGKITKEGIELEGFDKTKTLKWSDDEDKESVKEVKEKIRVYEGKKGLAKKIWDIKPYFYDESKRWWLWDNKKKRWFECDETDILNMVSLNTIANTVKSTEKNQILEAMKQHGRLNKPEEPKKTWVQFKDMIYDIKTGDKFKASPEYFITNPIPWELGYYEDTPEIDKLFKEWVGEDYVKTLHEICAYCMLPDYPIHRLFCLIGEGSNGKSKFLELLENLVDGENCTSTELENLINTRFEKAKLHKKSVCFMGETNFSNIKRTSLIKKLTGQDDIGAEKKNKDPFKFVNYAKILIATNGLPYSEDQTDGFFRRWCIIKFPNQFPEKNNLLEERIPEEEYKNMCRKSIRILKDLLDKMSFHNEGGIKQRKRLYNEVSNPINKFIEEECRKGGKIPFFKFYRELETFIENNQYRPLSKVETSRILKREGYEIKTEKREKSDGRKTTWKVIQGIELDYGEKYRYVVEEDLGQLTIPKEIKNKSVDDILVFNSKYKKVYEILEKEGYIRKLGEKEGGDD